MTIMVEELEKSFRQFAKESGRLSRLVQPKKKCPIPSEGFDFLVALRMDEVERAFRTYMRRKDELLTYILATASQETKTQRANRFSSTVSRMPGSKGDDNLGTSAE